MKRIALENLGALFAAISEKMRLYMPIDGKNGANYEEWAEGKTLSRALTTVRSAKDFFFPQTENLMDFKMEGKHIEVIDTREECENFALFGVRACDVRSFDILDRVFLSEPVDTYYKNRREHGVIFSLACARPAETCFCATFGIDAASPAGDVACYEAEGHLYLEAKTEKGSALLSSLGALLEDADASPVTSAQETIRARIAALPLAGLSADAFGANLTDEYFRDPAWAELSRSCLGCGTCTFVCPTCQCYDIRDIETADGVHRYRCWDSCMYSAFTKMAHGNPRLSQLERFRQRFMHKLVYYPTNNEGIFSCVGCGRCLAKCPINMNIVKVMKKLGGGKDA